MTTEEMNRITAEICNGSEHTELDDADSAAFREEVRPEIEQMKEDGVEVRLPNE